MQTPHDVTTTNSIYRGPFQNIATPARKGCLVYEPHSLDTARGFETLFASDACEWDKAAVPDDDVDSLSYKRSLFVHYCASYMDDKYAHCDNDFYTFEQRKRLCDELNGALLYTGLAVMDTHDAFDVDDLCNIETRTCYVVPGEHKFGGLVNLMAAAEARYGTLDDFTFKVTSVDIAILRNILLGGSIEDTSYLNSPAANPTAENRCSGHTTCKCCASDHECCTTCTREDIALIPNEGVISGQGLFEKSELIGRTLCNRLEAPTDDLFFNISAIEDVWKANPGVYNAEDDTYTVTGLDFPNHLQTAAITRSVTHPGSIFNTPIKDDGVVTITSNNVLITHVDPLKMVQFGTQQIVVRAEGFQIVNAVFNATGKPLQFLGSSVRGARIVNVTAPNAPVGVAFLGGVSVTHSAADDTIAGAFQTRNTQAGAAVYSPFTDVSGVTMEHVHGRNFSAAFARPTGVATVTGCAATLHQKCVIPHSFGPCRTWATAYNTLDHRENENWVLNATRHLVGPQGTPLVVEGYAVHHEHNRLRAGDMCVAAQDTYASRVPCEQAPFATETGHLEGAPFFCFLMYEGVARYSVCAGCNVGLGRHEPCGESGEGMAIFNETHCVTTTDIVPCTACGLENAACVARPVAHQILGCTARPHGAAISFDTTEPGIVPIPGGFGGLYNASSGTVIVGGYGYTPGERVNVHQILIEPAEHTSFFDIRVASAQIVNVTEYTSVFGAAYERAIFQPPIKTYIVVAALLIVAAILCVALLVMHVALLYKRGELWSSFARAVHDRVHKGDKDKDV